MTHSILNMTYYILYIYHILYIIYIYTTLYIKYYTLNIIHYIYTLHFRFNKHMFKNTTQQPRQSGAANCLIDCHTSMESNLYRKGLKHNATSQVLASFYTLV